MECRDVRELADSFLGEELLTETNHEILRHLETCPVCRADLDARRALRDGVRRAFHHAADLEPAPIHRGDANRAPGHPPSGAGSSRHPIAWMVGARGDGAAGGDGRPGVSRPRLDCGDRGARARRRRRSSELRAAFPSGGNANPARRCRALAMALRIASSRAAARRRHDDGWSGARPRAARVHLWRAAIRAHRARVSGPARVAARDGRRGRISAHFPGEALPHVTSARQVDHMSVVSFRASGHMVFLAGDVAHPDLTTLADAVAAPLYRELAGSLLCASSKNVFSSGPLAVRSLQRQCEFRRCSMPPPSRAARCQGRRVRRLPENCRTSIPISRRRERRRACCGGGARWQSADAVLIASPDKRPLPVRPKNAIDGRSAPAAASKAKSWRSPPRCPRLNAGAAASRPSAIRSPAAVRATIVGGEPIPKGPEHDRRVAELVRALIAAAANPIVPST